MSIQDNFALIERVVTSLNSLLKEKEFSSIDFDTASNKLFFVAWLGDEDNKVLIEIWPWHLSLLAEVHEITEDVIRQFNLNKVYVYSDLLTKGSMSLISEERFLDIWRHIMFNLDRYKHRLNVLLSLLRWRYTSFTDNFDASEIAQLLIIFSDYLISGKLYDKYLKQLAPIFKADHYRSAFELIKSSAGEEYAIALCIISLYAFNIGTKIPYSPSLMLKALTRLRDLTVVQSRNVFINFCDWAYMTWDVYGRVPAVENFRYWGIFLEGVYEKRIHLDNFEKASCYLLAGKLNNLMEVMA